MSGELERVAFAIGKVAGADAAAAAMAGITESITVRGVIGLAAVTSLTACAALGLSDFHDRGSLTTTMATPTHRGSSASSTILEVAVRPEYTQKPGEDDAWEGS